MGNRLSKIYTRTGDDGTTSLTNGKRLTKDSLIFDAIGDIDELNSHIGMIVALLTDTHPNIAKQLNIIQHLLFNLGGELAMPEFVGITDKHVHHLETWIDTINQSLPTLKDFILPKGTTLVCQTHIARTVARRAERSLVALHNDGYPVRHDSLKFINRLSDHLFVLSRHLTPNNLVTETLWNHQILQSLDIDQLMDAQNR